MLSSTYFTISNFPDILKLLKISLKRRETELDEYLNNFTCKLTVFITTFTSSPIQMRYKWAVYKAFLQGRTNTNQQQNSESDSLVKVPVLHCDGHQQSTNEQHVRVLQILNTDLKKTLSSVGE